MGAKVISRQSRTALNIRQMRSAAVTQPAASAKVSAVAFASSLAAKPARSAGGTICTSNSTTSHLTRSIKGLNIVSPPITDAAAPRALASFEATICRAGGDCGVLGNSSSAAGANRNGPVPLKTPGHFLGIAGPEAVIPVRDLDQAAGESSRRLLASISSSWVITPASTRAIRRLRRALVVIGLSLQCACVEDTFVARKSGGSRETWLTGAVFLRSFLGGLALVVETMTKSPLGRIQA